MLQPPRPQRDKESRHFFVARFSGLKAATTEGTEGKREATERMRVLLCDLCAGSVGSVVARLLSGMVATTEDPEHKREDTERFPDPSVSSLTSP